jgi:hypothetical protein
MLPTPKTSLQDKGNSAKINPIMGKVILILAAVSAHTALAVRIEERVCAPVPSAFADGEAAEEAASLDRDALLPEARTVRLTFTVENPSPTNSAVASIGVPGLFPSGGGVPPIGGGVVPPMSLASTLASLTYDGGSAEWQLRHDGFRQRHTAPVVKPSATGARSLVATVLVNTSSGEPVSVSFAEGRSPVVFGGMCATNAVLLSLFNPANFGLMRVTSRGGAEASLKMEIVQSGTVMTLR